MQPEEVAIPPLYFTRTGAGAVSTVGGDHFVTGVFQESALLDSWIANCKSDIH